MILCQISSNKSILNLPNPGILVALRRKCLHDSYSAQHLSFTTEMGPKVTYSFLNIPPKYCQISFKNCRKIF